MLRVATDNDESERTMRDGGIQAVAIASGSGEDNIVSRHIPKSERYGAASLSKPVFSYLVLKLIGSDGFELDTKLHTILSFKDFCETVGKELFGKEFNIIWDDSAENIARAEQFTPAMILSHQTGLPIGYKSESGRPLQFDFEPGQGFAYSGIHLMYLQACLEIKFEKKLEKLAETYVFKPARMNNSSFDTPVANAANSLHTTAEDYVRFCLHMLHDPDPHVQEAFTCKVSMRDDPWAVRENIPIPTLNHLAWGYGWGLELDDDGRVISAFHTGDMNEWQAGVKLDLISESVTVFLSKSTYGNGHLLQDQVFGRSYALDYFFDKFKFARTVDELKDDWRQCPSCGERKATVQSENKRMGGTADILVMASSAPAESAKHQLQVATSAPKVVIPEPSAQTSPASPFEEAGKCEARADEPPIGAKRR